jgi:hypothetical protein
MRQAWILAGIAGAVLAVGYLATMREVNATVTAGEATVTYQSGIGAAGAPAPIEDSHQRMLELIEESNQALSTYDATRPPPFDPANPLNVY